VQSGKPVGIFRTHPDAPRVLIANANLVPHWATADEFRRLEGLGLTMYGQMTAGSWIYIGTQGILQGTYECFAAAARKHFGGTLRGRVVVTAGLGGMGGAQPLAATMNGGAFLAAEVDETRIDKRLATGYLDEKFSELDAAIERTLALAKNGEARSVAWLPNAADLLSRLIARGIVPDVLTDQTSAHDELTGYVPQPDDARRGGDAAPRGPREVQGRGVPDHGRAHARDARVAAPGRRHLRLRQQPARAGDQGGGRGRVPGHRFRAALRPPAFLRGQGAVPLGGALREARGHLPHRQGDPRGVPKDEALCRWIRMAGERVHFQGLPARICWLGYGDRARFGLIINDLVGRGEISAPIVIGRDHLDSGSVASPTGRPRG